VAVRLRLHFDAGGGTASDEADFCGDGFGHFGDVGDDADFATEAFQLHEGVGYGAQGFLIERSEAFVDEEAFDAEASRCDGREAQCEREGYDEGFTPTQAGGGAPIFAHFFIDDGEVE